MVGVVRCAGAHRALGETATGPRVGRAGGHMTQGAWSFRRAATPRVSGGAVGGLPHYITCTEYRHSCNSPFTPKGAYGTIDEDFFVLTCACSCD